MKYILFFILFISCETTTKTYMCGETPCLDRKELKEYFADSLTIEIQKNKSSKKSSIDLVKLNTEGKNLKNKNKYSKLQIEKDNKKEREIILKTKKKRLKQERKMKKIIEKQKIKEEKKLVKLKKIKKNKLIIFSDGTRNNKIIKNTELSTVSKKPTNTEKDKKNIFFKSVRSKSQETLCDDIKNCDIDKIAEILSKKGMEKKFPDISKK